MAMTQEVARRAQLKAVAEAYLEGMGKKDMSKVPWDDHVVLRSPLAPGGLDTPLVGRSAVLDWFSSLFPVLGAMQVIEHYFNEDLTVIASQGVEADIWPSSVWCQAVTRWRPDAA